MVNRWQTSHQAMHAPLKQNKTPTHMQFGCTHSTPSTNPYAWRKCTPPSLINGLLEPPIRMPSPASNISNAITSLNVLPLAYMHLKWVEVVGGHVCCNCMWCIFLHLQLPCTNITHYPSPHTWYMPHQTWPPHDPTLEASPHQSLPFYPCGSLAMSPPLASYWL